MRSTAAVKSRVRRVKIPALVHLTRLGYEYLSPKNYHGIIHPDTNIFVDIFRESISCINGKTLSEQDAAALISELSIKLSNEDLGKAFYNILLNGINGIRLIDFENSSRNTYHVVTELTYRNGDDEFRPDIILLRIQPDISASFVLAIPDNKTMRAFVELYAPIMEKQKALYKENRELAKLRDWLLPMLMNGQATVEYQQLQRAIEKSQIHW